MGLFERAVAWLEKTLASGAPMGARYNASDETDHLALLTESSSRISDTLAAISAGNLVAATSTTEGIRFDAEQRLTDKRAPVTFARADQTTVGALGNRPGSFADRITNPGGSKSTGRS